MDNKYYRKFIELIKDQFTYGGIKYGLAATRESTDELFDIFGKNWLFGTIAKYCFRYKKLKRERDLLKIATYAYILWLKRGFYIMDKGINDPAIDTNTTQKNANYDKFISRVTKEKLSDTFDLLSKAKKDESVAIDFIKNTLTIFANKQWGLIEESSIIYVFCLCYYEWHNNYRDVKSNDKDTYNEERDK